MLHHHKIARNPPAHLSHNKVSVRQQSGSHIADMHLRVSAERGNDLPLESGYIPSPPDRNDDVDKFSIDSDLLSLRACQEAI